MPTSLPTVRGGANALMPLDRTVSFDTDICEFQAGNEQRFKQRMGLYKFALPYNRVNKTDKEAIRSFLASSKGMANTTLNLLLGSTTYSNLTLMSDEFAATENPTTLYTTNLALRQVMNGTAIAGVSGSAYPAMAVGVVSQLPYTQKQRYFTDVADNPTGMRYGWSWYGSGLAGFPTRGLFSWTLTNVTMTDVDLTALEGFFDYVCGRWGTFSFTDPDSGTVYSNCHFDMDELTIRKTGPNLNAVSVTIRESSISLNAGHGAVTVASLAVWSAYTTNAIAGSGNAQFDYSSNGGATWTGLFNSADYAKQLNTFTISDSDLSQLQVRFYPLGSLYVDPANAVLQIYDCAVTVTYADATNATRRPTGYGVALYTGTVTNPTLAYDADASPPTTYATITTPRFAPLGSSNVLTLTGFTA